MRRNLMTGGLLAATLLIAPGCEDLLTEVDLPQNELTEDEVSEMATAMADLSYDAASAEATDQGSAQGALLPAEHGGTHFSREISVTRSCPLGGEVAIEGEVAGLYDAEEDRLVVELGATKTPADCVVVARLREFTLNGDPNLHVTARIEKVAGALHGEQRIDIEGGFAWSGANDRAGTCDVVLAIRIHPEEQTRTLVGTFCGTEIESTTSWTTD